MVVYSRYCIAPTYAWYVISTHTPLFLDVEMLCRDAYLVVCTNTRHCTLEYGIV